MTDGKFIGDVIGGGVLATPDEPAATLGEEQVSFRELDRWADRLAAVLLRLGAGHGSVVAWFAAPALHNLAGLLACARVGAIYAPLPPSSDAETARDALEAMDAELLVCDGERLELSCSLPVARLAVFGTSATDAPEAGRATSQRAVVIDLERLEAEVGSEAEAGPRANRDPALRDTDPHILYLTSGSTGKPKGVLVSHRASWLRSAPEHDQLQPWADGILCTFPIHHYGGLHYVLEAWLRHTAVHLVSRATGPEVVAAVERRRPTAIYCIPAVWARVFETPGDLSSIEFADTGTSAVAETLLAGIAQRLPGARTRILYGATEAGRMAALEPSELAERPGSVGRPPGDTRIRIADDGEVLFSGETLMNGYHRRPHETATAIEQGWYHTGDLGRLDEHGYLYLTGRKRDMIRSGGEWVSPAKIDAALAGVPGLRDAAVVGLADERWGEVVCAAVVPAEGHPPPAAGELRERLAGLASHEHPRVVATVAEIPRTSATGQVMRVRLRAMIEQAQQPHEGGES